MGTVASGRRKHHSASPLYLDGNHLLHLRVQILERLTGPISVVRLAIGGRSAGRRASRSARCGVGPFPARTGHQFPRDGAHQAAAAGPGEPHHPPHRRGAPTRSATCARKASASHLRRGVRNPWCPCPASWHRAVSCPSASVETPVIRAVDPRRCARCRHTAGRTAVNCRNRRNRPVWKVATFYPKNGGSRIG